MNIEIENEKEEKGLNETTDNVHKTGNKDKKETEGKPLKISTPGQKNNDTSLPKEKSNDLKNNQKQEVELFIIPNNLQRSLLIILSVTVLGAFIIALGFFRLLTQMGIIGPIILFVLGILIIIPSGYYAFRFYRAKLAKSAYARKEILDSIPRI